MTLHAFNFEGGEYLTEMGATWFVSYSYKENINQNHLNWARVTTYKRRISIYNKTKQYHTFWLQKILSMNPKQLNKNEIGITPNITKKHAKEILIKHGISVASDNSKIIIFLLFIAIIAYFLIKYAILKEE